MPIDLQAMEHKQKDTRTNIYICDSDVIKQNQFEVRNIDFKIELQNRKCLLFPIVFGILQLLISLEPIDQFQWSFLQTAAVKMVNTVC